MYRKLRVFSYLFSVVTTMKHALDFLPQAPEFLGLAVYVILERE